MHITLSFAVGAARGIGLLLAAALLFLAADAQAAPPVLWEPDRCQPATSPAGQACSLPRGVVANPEDGRVLVNDQGHQRVIELTAWGDFVKAWGWDVIASGPGDDTSPPEDEFEICVPADGDICKSGLEGSGDGQLSAIAAGVALDSAGSIYVTDRGFLGDPSVRVQKFSADGEFVLMFGGDVNKTKVDASAPEAERNVCTAASGDVCQKGTVGSGDGQFGEWAIGDFIAVDTKGSASDVDDDVWVGDVGRVQRFNSGGAYEGECAVPGTVQSLAVDAAGNLYAVYGGEIHKLSPSCEELTTEFPLTDPNGNAVEPTAVAVDAAGHVFAFGPISFSAGQPMDPIFEFDPSGKEVDNFGKGDFDGSTGIATNLCPGSEAPGNLYVTNFSEADAFVRAYGTAPIGCFRVLTGAASAIGRTTATLGGTVTPEGGVVSACSFEYGTDQSYGQSAPCTDPDASEIGSGDDPVAVRAELSGLLEATVYHFRLRATIDGEIEQGADASFKTLGPPVISDEHTKGATDSEATLEALVNPEGLPTTYRFEYGLTDSYGALSDELPAGADREEHAAVTTLEGLEPGVLYHWRIVATNASGTSFGDDRTVVTYRRFAAEDDCSNQELRIAASAFLPDCRAYEMVSPVDKNGGDITAGVNADRDPGRYVQATAGGDRLTYTTISSYGDQPSNLRFSQYLVARGAGGWTGSGIQTPVVGPPAPGVNFGLHRMFMAFTEDLCSAWLIDYQALPPSSDGQPGYRNLYRRDNCAPGAGGLEALTPAPPELAPETPDDYVENESVQGISADGSRAFFVAKARLPHVADAAASHNAQVYGRFTNQLFLVSVLPDGSSGDPAPGDGRGFADTTTTTAVGSSWTGNLQGAVSADGRRVYWTSGGRTGRIFVRSRPEQGIVNGECTEPADPCTRRVDTVGGSFFWAAAKDGSLAIYSREGAGGQTTLTEYDLLADEAGEDPRRTVADDIEGVVGASEDLSHVYFLSREALTGAEENSEGQVAQEGEPNLYLDQGGALSFVATLTEGDVGAIEPDGDSLAYDLDSSRSTGERAVRVNPGGTLAFQSRARLTAFDNTGEQGRALVEVFAYDPAAKKLLCISCNPSDARAGEAEMHEPYKPPWQPTIRKTKVFAAAWIPALEHPLHYGNVLSRDGERILFNSYDALLPRDTNDRQDVYEWEAPGKGGCTEGSPSFFAENGGCLYLISSGDSRFDSEVWAASPSGDDVFFTTESSLVEGDPGLVDLYDARVGGGFPPKVVPVECEGEACQSPPPPPDFGTPASGAFSGPTDPARTSPKPRRCPKGKRRVRRKGKVRCVKRRPVRKQTRSHQRTAHNGRRAAR